MASTIARPTTPPNRHAWEQTTYPISPSTYSTGMKSSPRRRPPPAFPNSPRRHREADPRSSSSSVDLATARGETSYPDDHQRQTQYSSERWNGASEDLYGAMGALQTPQMLRVPPTPVTAFPLPTPTMRSRRDSGLALQVDAARPSSIGPSRSPAKASIGLGIAAAVIGNSSSSRGAPALSSEAKTKATSPYAKPMALPSENAQASMANPTAKHTRARSGSVPRARLLIGLRDLAPQYWSVGNGDVTVCELTSAFESRLLTPSSGPLAVIPFDPRSQRQSHSAKSMSPRPGTRANPAQAQVVYCFAAGPSRAGEGSGKNVPPLTPPSATASDSRRVDQTTRHRAAPSNDDGDPDRTPRRPSLELERESPVKPHHPPPVARPVMKYQLHRDFLIVQSAGLRDLLVRPMANGVSAGATAARMSSLRGARLLPSAPGQPMLLWLPLPDPSSFPTLVHWMYW